MVAALILEVAAHLEVVVVPMVTDSVFYKGPDNISIM